VPKSLQVDQDNLRMKFSTLLYSFHWFNFRPPCVQEILRTWAPNLGTFFPNAGFRPVERHKPRETGDAI